MNIPGAHPKINATHLSLESLASNKTLSDGQKIGEVSRQFEAMLVRQILQEARKTESSTNSTANSIYDDMVNTQMADSVSQSGALGLAKSLQAQLSHQVLKAAPAPPAETAPVKSNSHKP